jgi:hypothetical protein
MKVIEENILKVMDPADRAKLPRRVRLTAAERQTAAEHKLEKEMHNGFAGWLRLHKKIFSFNHADPSRPSTMRKGWPDFSIHRNNQTLLIEFKVPPNGLTKDQFFVFSELHETGNDVIVCTTLEDAIHLTIERFNLPPEWKEIQ